VSTDPAPLPTHSHPTTALDATLAAQDASLSAAIARIAALEVRVGALEGAPPPPPPSAVYATAAAQSKGNIQIGGTDHQSVACLFVAARTGTIVAVRGALRGGTGGYSNGSGGTVRRSIQPEGGGAILGAPGSITPGNPGTWATYPELLLSADVVAGQRYYVVDDNTDADPATNFVSSNHLFQWQAPSPHQPRYADTDYAIYVRSGGGAWVVDWTHSSVMDIRYADGFHQGLGYVGMIGGITGLPGAKVSYAPISGIQKARQTFSVAAPQPFSHVAVGGIRLDHGSDPLFLTLRAGASQLGEVQVAPIPVDTQSGLDKGGSVWVGGTLAVPAVLSGTCELRLSSAASSLWTVAPIRDGTDVGFDPSICFPGGRFEVSSDNATTWKDPYFGGILDMQIRLS
jgi:hypothetical protein